MKKILIGFIAIGLLSFVGCGTSKTNGSGDLDAALSVTGQKLDRGYSRTGAYEGYSFWTFDGSNLKVEYTLKMNTTIEQQLLDNGRVERAIEEYTIENLKPSYKYDGDRKEVRKGYWGDWGNARFHFGLKHSEKGYYIKFEVQWSNGNAWCNYKHNLSEEDQADILKRFLITDEADENYIAAKEKVEAKLIPQVINYDGKPDLEYFINDEIIALDSYNENDLEGSYIRMKFNNKVVILKLQKLNKNKRVYSNNEYSAIFHEITYGECGGGYQNLRGKLLIKTKSEQNTLIFKGSDTFLTSEECEKWNQ